MAKTKKTVEDAIELATEAHRYQLDKNGEHYIYHPLRVMLSVVGGDYVRMCAILHDVVEDTDWTMECISEEGFPNDVVKAVKAITHKKGQPYQEYLDVVKANDIARAVKIADIKDNMDPDRMVKLDWDTITRLITKYAMALKFLTDD